MRKVEYRMDVLRNGVPYDQLQFSSAPSVYSDSTTQIKLTMRGEFLHNERVDYIKDELRPVMIIDGVEHFLGTYVIVTKREVGNAAGVKRDSIEAYDRAQRLKWAKLEHRDFWAAGTPYETVISHYLTAAGIKNAMFTPTSNVLQSDREDWDIGTEYLTIINTLLSEINYNDIYFDLSGTARLTPYVAPSAENIAHRYGKSDGVTVLRPEYGSEIDLYSKPNVFIAILENPEYATPMVKYAENDTPGSRLSTISRGIRIPAVYKVDNIASENELQAYVNRIRDESMQMSEYVDIQTANMPGHEVYNVIALVMPEITGIFREVSWTLTMQVGAYMQHKLQRVVIM